MIRRHLFNAAVVLALVAALFGLNRSTVSAAPALNDNFASATQIGALPFLDVVDVSEATLEPGESLACFGMANTVWYAYTPSVTSQVNVSTVGSSAGNNGFNVYRAYGPGLGYLSHVTCGAHGGVATFSAQAGETYYIQAGTVNCGYPPCSTLELSVQQYPPPPNDNMANALAATNLPFDHYADWTGATREAEEPHPSCDPDPNSKTVWYAMTPATNGSHIAYFPYGAWFSTMVAVYTGSPATGLTEVGCRVGSALTFEATRGTTYYVQVAALYGNSGAMTLRLDVTPPPNANFYWYGSGQSTLDVLQFSGSSYDPAGVGIQTEEWDFGDGATATGCCPTHQYRADGDYTVTLTVTTYDGRTGSATQTIAIRTHDVAVTKFQVPSSASAGQTRQIVVGLRNSNQPETVRVELYRSTAYGFQLIGTLEQYVPVRPSNRTTDFAFSYTFTAADAQLGKVNFSATAVILGNQDRLPADNQAISLPTRVGR